jgi:hypothetical protein
MRCLCQKHPNLQNMLWLLMFANFAMITGFVYYMERSSITFVVVLFLSYTAISCLMSMSAR